MRYLWSKWHDGIILLLQLARAEGASKSACFGVEMKSVGACRIRAGINRTGDISSSRFS